MRWYSGDFDLVRDSDVSTRPGEHFEAMNMIRKGQIRWLQKGDILGQVAFITALFGIAIAA